VWVEPLPSEQELAAHYQRSYQEGGYALFSAAEPIRRGIARYRLEKLRSLLPAGRWLDVGCSAGEFVEAALQEGVQAEGLDLAEEALARARQRGLRVHGSGVEGFAPEQPYDAVTAFDMLEHARNPRATLGHFRDWLRPGGKLVLTVPDVGSFYPRWLMRRHWFYYAPDEHLFYFDRHTLARLLEVEGFQVERLARAYKPLTVEYAARMLRHFNAALGGVAEVLVRPLPRALRTRSVPLFVGELLAVARRPEEARP